MPKLQQPVFLVGARRSGSSLLRVMINSHPSICFPRHFEIELAVQFIGEDPALPTSLQPYYDMIESSYEFRDKGHVIDKSLALRPLLDSFLQQSIQASGKPLVMAAVHDNFDRLLRIWPDARFIYLIRDGRDVARSRTLLGWDANGWTAAEPWIVAERQWNQVQQDVPEEGLLETRYEDLVSDPVAELTRICNFLGTPYDAAIFDYLNTTDYTKPDSKMVAGWRSKLSDSEVSLIEARIGPQLSARGYELSDLPKKEVTSTVARRLERQSTWARRRADIDRKGLWLFLLDFLTRKLGAAKWQRQVRLMIDTRRQDSLR